MSDVLDAVRAAAARVVARARSVRLDDAGLGALAERMADDRAPAPAWDAATHHVGTPASRLAFVVTLDAINFGSGWFPRLRKRDGRSGYYTVAMGLRDHFDAKGPWSAAALEALGPRDLAAVTGQDPDDPEVAELMALFARALRDLGHLLRTAYGGSFERLVDDAERSAARLVVLLARMPLYRDVACYDGLEVPFYKRAQITAADLELAFAGEGPGRFEDLDRLTCFADNLVPHVLRLEGVLHYAPGLLSRIESGELLEPGGAEEVEIRAAAVHGVERLVAALRERGRPVSAREVDMILWLRGQQPAFKARPRHRARCPYY